MSSEVQFPALEVCFRFHFCPLPQGYDPDTKPPFQPKPKQKGRSSTASLVKRKRKVMDEEHRVSEHLGMGRAACGLCPPACTFGLASLPLLTSPLSPHSRTKSDRAWSSSRRSKRRPSPWGPGHLPWTDLCAESGSRGSWEQHSLPKTPVGNDLFPGMRREQ